MKKYLHNIQEFTSWLNGRGITKEPISEWKAHLMAQNYAPAAINAMLSAPNSLLELLDLRECRVKFLKIQRRLFRDASRELARAEYDRLLSSAKTWGRNALRC